MKKAKSKKWIQGAIKHPGALRRTAAKMGLVKKHQKLSNKDLQKLESKAKKSGNTTLARRVNLAKTLKKMRKRK